MRFVAYLLLLLATPMMGCNAECQNGALRVGNACVKMGVAGIGSIAAGSSAGTMSAAVAGATAAAEAGKPATGGASAGRTSERASGGSGGGATAGQSAAGSSPSAGEQAGQLAGGTGGSATVEAPPACGNGKQEGAELCDGTCLTECPAPADSSACVVMTLVGAAATCDAQCEMSKITECFTGDGCCAEGCNYGTDQDCSASCGDGVLTGTEKCEPTSPEKPCPSEADCKDDDPCTVDEVAGAADQCSAECVHSPAKTGDQDSCCPEEANANNDPDCQPKCGNGVKEDGEGCDGDCVTGCQDDGNACTTEMLMGTPGECNTACMSIRVGTGTENACGGCEALNPREGAPCDNGQGGTCARSGTYECTGKNTVECNAEKVRTGAESCNEEDDDCDGKVDENVGKTWYQDCDGDGYPANGAGVDACSEPPQRNGCGWISTAPGAGNTDCNDQLAVAHPGAGLGLPIEEYGDVLPASGSQDYDLNCDGTQKYETSKLSTGVIKNGQLELIDWCPETFSCVGSTPLCVTTLTSLGESRCGIPCGSAACDKNVKVYATCN